MSPKAWAKFFTSPFILQAHWQLRFHLKQCPLRWLSLEADTEIQKILAIPIYIFSEQKHFFSKNAKKKKKNTMTTTNKNHICFYSYYFGGTHHVTGSLHILLQILSTILQFKII